MAVGFFTRKSRTGSRIPRATIRLTDAFTGNDFADFLLGYAQNYTEDAIKDSGHWNNVSWALYFQDNYRVNNRLTLNLGLRWDGIPHTYEANSQMANFYPGLYNASQPALLATGGNTICNGVDVATGCTAVSPGLGPSPIRFLRARNSTSTESPSAVESVSPKGCVNNAWLNFQPRLGFAYDIKGDGKTVIRGGYAIMNERDPGQRRIQQCRHRSAGGQHQLHERHTERPRGAHYRRHS